MKLSGRLWSQAVYGLQSRDQDPEQERASDSRSLCRIQAGAQWSPVTFLAEEAYCWMLHKLKFVGATEAKVT